MKAKRATKAIVQARIDDILRIRLDGAQAWDLCAFVREKEKEPGSPWELAPGQKPLSESQLRRYMAKADALIFMRIRGQTKRRRRLITRHVAIRHNLYAKALSAGDYRTALAAVKDEADLLGLYPPKKIAPTNPTGEKEYAPLTADERLAALRNLYASLGISPGETPTNGDGATHRPLLG
jgi:hypothetical protein